MAGMLPIGDTDTMARGSMHDRRNGHHSHAEDLVEEVERAGVGSLAMGAGGAALGSAVGPEGTAIGAVMGVVAGLLLRLLAHRPHV